MAPFHDQEQQPVDQHPALTVHWYVVGGALLGCVTVLLGVTVCAYRCYRRYNGQGVNNRRLSSAIRKGLKAESSGSMKKSPSLRSTGSGGRAATPLLQGQQSSDVPIPERRLSKSPTNQGIEPTQINTQCYVSPEQQYPQCQLASEKDESLGARSPEEKTDSLKEKSEDEQKITKLGTLHFAVDYDKQKTALVVTILRACDLPAKDPNVGSSDPYVKLQLLPEKRHKVKTRVLRKTLNPLYDEIFTFYGIDYNQLQAITLHFVALSFDRFSRDDIIGEVIYPLAGVDVSCQEVTLCKEISPRHIKMHSQGRGELLVSLCYQPAANRLTVVVLKARNLPKMDITGLSDPYVKIYLLYNGQRIAKKKTHVKKRTLNPVFNESFLFDVPCNEGLHNLSLEFLLLDWDRMTKNEVVGRLEISNKTMGPESHHWNEVMNCPRKQIAEWHKLKE